MNQQATLFASASTEIPIDPQTQARLGQYQTPQWAAQALVEQFFADLTATDRVWEPTCGTGNLLKAIPDYVPAVGVEIDARLAQIARANTGREVIVGDFRTAQLPFAPTAVIGNPPFAKADVMALLDRSWDLLPDEGRAGLLLPAFLVSTASTVEQLAARWHLEQSLVPRALWPRLQHPLCFVMLRKGARRGLVGFSLFHEQAAVSRLQKRYRALLAGGEGSVWAAVTRAALETCGGRATLQELYREIQGQQPTDNPFWQAKVRQVVQKICDRVGPATWALRTDAAKVA